MIQSNNHVVCQINCFFFNNKENKTVSHFRTVLDRSLQLDVSPSSAIDGVHSQEYIRASNSTQGLVFHQGGPLSPCPALLRRGTLEFYRAPSIFSISFACFLCPYTIHLSRDQPTSWGTFQRTNSYQFPFIYIYILFYGIALTF